MASIEIKNRNDRWSIRRVYCVGRNYADHAREMGADPEREAPFFFAKPADAVCSGNVPYPTQTRDFQHEVELVITLGHGGSQLTPTEAADLIWGYAVGIDWTRRDLQAEAKRLGRPWETAKAFDYSASIGALYPRSDVGTIDTGRIWLAVNGSVRQDANLSDMIWKPAEIIAELSQYFELAAGDLIYTGTPAGVGAVNLGDEVTAGIEGLETLSMPIVAR